MVIKSLGLDCLPASICWFEEVDVDTVLRKKVDDPQLTPTQTEPIKPGYTITPDQLKISLEKDLTFPYQPNTI